MKKLLLFLFAFTNCLLIQAQNGEYISDHNLYYQYPQDPNPQYVLTDHKFILSVNISEFSGLGSIVVKDMDAGTTVSYEIIGKVKDMEDIPNKLFCHYYLGNLKLYGLSQEAQICLFVDPETGKLKDIVFISVKFKSESHYIHLKPLEETLSSTGSGVVVSDKGYIVTNYHVVKGAKSLTITGIKNNFQRQYTAALLAFDEVNDLALLKVSGVNDLPPITFSIPRETADVGEHIFVLGYPLLSSMGSEVKLTDGLISATSGYAGDTRYYQVSSPIQPGNSGGPLFNANGDVIGIVTAKHINAENVGYALKSNLLISFLTLHSVTVKNSNQIKSIGTLSAKVKDLKKYVVIIQAER